MRKSTSASTRFMALVLACAPVACSNTVEGVKKDAKENRVEERAEKAVEKVAEAVHEAGHEIRVHALAIEIKAALVADKRVEAGGISVDANEDTRTVTLKGSVPSEAQREAAERTARKKAKGYRVRNLLTVGRAD